MIQKVNCIHKLITSQVRIDSLLFVSTIVLGIVPVAGMELIMELVFRGSTLSPLGSLYMLYTFRME